MLMKKLTKRLAGCALCGTLLIGTMGMTSLAANNVGRVSGSATDTSASATVYNQSNSTRYCSITIRQSDNQITYSSTIASNSGVISRGNILTTSGRLTMKHARGYGIVYNAQSTASGTAWSGYTNLR